MMSSLNNEIGVLRGIAYCLEASGTFTPNDEFLMYIAMQQDFKATEAEALKNKKGE